MAALKEIQPPPVEVAAAPRRMQPRIARADAQPGANDVAALQSRLTSAFSESERGNEAAERLTLKARSAIIVSSSAFLWAAIIMSAKLLIH